MLLGNLTSNLGTLLSGIAATFTCIFTILSWYYSRKIKKQTECFMQIDPVAIQNHLSNEMLKKIEDLDVHNFFTLDMAFPSGEVINIPMIEDTPIMVFENITMTVMAHTKDYTIALVKCKGYGTIPTHSHSNSFEEIQVFEGTMTCLETGQQFKKGDIWRIETNKPHGALLHNCYALITYKPPLLTASERPVNLHSMESIFKKI